MAALDISASESTSQASTAQQTAGGSNAGVIFGRKPMSNTTLLLIAATVLAVFMIWKR